MGRVSAKLCGTAVVGASAFLTSLASSESPDAKAPSFLLYLAHPSMPVPPLQANPECSCLLKVASHPVQTSSNTASPAASSSFKEILASASINRNSPANNCSTVPETIRTLSLSPTPISNQSPLLELSSSLSPLRFSLVNQKDLSLLSSATDWSRLSTKSWSSSWMLSSFRESSSPSDRSKSDSKAFDSKKEQYCSEIGAADAGKKANRTVILLGWLGAQQRHLRRYAEWYNERGINAVTFVIPMRDVMSLNIGNKSEEEIQHLAKHLVAWLSKQDKDEDNRVIFHTFSNTGWLAYGVILEKLLQKDRNLLSKIKGCVIDSAPSAKADPQVWASGFSAAFFQKRSVASKKFQCLEPADGGVCTVDKKSMNEQPEPELVEVAVRTVLEKFFSSFLQVPYVKQRLAEVVNVLSEEQPHCPQLYMYSSADMVIPAKSVESFIQEQQKAGRVVKACNLIWSPHVDHFRSFPEVYGAELSNFIQECFPS